MDFQLSERKIELSLFKTPAFVFLEVTAPPAVASAARRQT